MWVLIDDCGKQIIPHCRLREKNDNDIKIYEVTMVEPDQYRVKMLTKNDQAPAEETGMILTCKQLMEYRFEIETT